MRTIISYFFRQKRRQMCLKIIYSSQRILIIFNLNFNVLMTQSLTSRSRKHSLNKQNYTNQSTTLGRVKSYSLNKKSFQQVQYCQKDQQKYLMGWGSLPQFTLNQSSKIIHNIAKHSISYTLGQKFIAYVDSNYSLQIIGQIPTQQLKIFSKGQTKSQGNAYKKIMVKKVFSSSFSIFLITCQNEVLAFGLNNRGQLGINNTQSTNFPTIIKQFQKYQTNQSQLGHSSRKRSSSKIKINSVCYQNKVLGEQNLNKLQRNGINLAHLEKNRDTFLTSEEEIIKIEGGPFHTIALTNKGKVYYAGNLYSKRGLQTDQYLTSFQQISLNKVGKVINIKAGLTNIGMLNDHGRLFLMGLFNQNNIFDLPHDIQIDGVKSFAISDNNVYIVNEAGLAFKINMKNKTLKTSKYNSQNLFQSVQSSIDYVIFIAQSGLLYGQGNNLNGQILIDKNLKHVQTLTLIDYFQFKFPISQIKCSPKFTIISSQKVISSHQNLNVYQYLNKQKKSLSAIQTSKKSIRIQTQNQVKSLFSNLLLTLNPRTFPNDLQIQFSQIKIGKKIAEGGYGIIYQGQWRKSIVAVKIFKIDQNNQNSIKDFVSECHAMETLRHPSIVMFLGACIKPPNFAIVLQYCEGGTLWSLLQGKIQLSWVQRVKFALDIARAMNYLHSRSSPILHRDLKSLNILLDGNRKIKLADFGWTKGLQNYMTGKIGTYQWMAPQVIAAQQYTQKADIFSFSIILWEIASRQAPYKNIQGLQVAYDVVNKDLRPTIPKNTPQIFSQLIIKCWNKQASMRPSFNEIIDQLQKIGSLLK